MQRAEKGAAGQRGGEEEHKGGDEEALEADVSSGGHPIQHCGAEKAWWETIPLLGRLPSRVSRVSRGLKCLARVRLDDSLALQR